MAEMNFGLVLIVIGIIIALFGIAWYVGAKFFGIGRLPGDIAVEGENFKFYFPIMSSIVISILLTLGFLVFGLIKRYLF